MEKKVKKEKFTPGPWKAHTTLNADWVMTDWSGCEEQENICDLSHSNGGNDVYLIAAAPEMYEALEDVCGDCEKLSNWEDLFNIGRPGGTIMPPCPCKECHVGRILKKARGEA